MERQGSISLYMSEIIEFLKTVTIKFEPFCYLYDRSYAEKYQYSKTLVHDPDNPYYKILYGNYDITKIKPPIMVYVVEKNTEEILTKSLLEANDFTSQLYKIPKKEYYNLVSKYPQHEGIIRQVIYRVPTTLDVVYAPNLSLLHYDDSLLYSYERDSLLTTLHSFLSEVRERWWIPEFCYEELYPYAFWMLLWQTLPNVLYVQRLSHIKQFNVHPFHIWEYLFSKGIGDYRDILTVQQSLWLYKNLGWITTHKGKHKTLYELAENILSSVNADLNCIDIYQNTEELENKTLTIPKFISEKIQDTYSTHPVKTDIYSIEELLRRIAESKLDTSKTYDEVKLLAERYSYVRDSDLATKFLEIKRYTISTTYQEKICEFLYDTFMYRYTQNDLQFPAMFIDPLTGKSYEIPVDLYLYLLYYFQHKVLGTEPTYLPRYYPARLAYTREPVYAENYENLVFDYLGNTYPIASVVDVPQTLQRIPFYPNTYPDYDTYVSVTINMLHTYLQELPYITRGSDVYDMAMYHIYTKVLVNADYIRKDPSISTYDELMENNSLANYFISTYTDKVSINKLLENLYPVILFLKHPKITEHYGIYIHDEVFYQKLKNLFIQFCSYNVVFLDTEPEYYYGLHLPVVLSHTLSTISTKRIPYCVINITGYPGRNSITTPTVCTLEPISSEIHQGGLKFKRLQLDTHQMLVPNIEKHHVARTTCCVYDLG